MRKMLSRVVPMMNYMGTCDTVLTPTLDTQAMSLKMKTQKLVFRPLKKVSNFLGASLDSAAL